MKLEINTQFRDRWGTVTLHSAERRGPGDPNAYKVSITANDKDSHHNYQWIKLPVRRLRRIAAAVEAAISGESQLSPPLAVPADLHKILAAVFKRHKEDLDELRGTTSMDAPVEFMNLLYYLEEKGFKA